MAILNIKNFPDPLYERLRHLAQAERRSISQQVILLVERAVQEEPDSPANPSEPPSAPGGR